VLQPQLIAVTHHYEICAADVGTGFFAGCGGAPPQPPERGPPRIHIEIIDRRRASPPRFILLKLLRLRSPVRGSKRGGGK
jgi:hypothetical protein